ncbi:hypothetical protein M758_2G183600 [Ceratodon purpureus]|nr:hypothetical protein M758_2G183600 [Ceratodon purpureus]
MGKEKITLATTWIVMAAMLAVFVSASDPDPLQDFCIADVWSWTHVNGYACYDPLKARNEDFVYRGLRKAGDTTKEFGAPITEAFVKQWPALNTQGISWARVDYAVNGLNNLHWHPRASEIFYCQEGTLLVGFVDTIENKFWYNTLEPGDLAIIPRGLLHFDMNIGTKPAMAHNAHNSQNPGHQAEGKATFGSYPPIGDNVLTKGFDLDEKTVQQLKQFFAKEKIQDQSLVPDNSVNEVADFDVVDR